jgi:ABC-type bacteriocin/lantibiotic exporter with double-glycine peptidase domain
MEWVRVIKEWPNTVKKWPRCLKCWIAFLLLVFIVGVSIMIWEFVLDLRYPGHNFSNIYYLGFFLFALSIGVFCYHLWKINQISSSD